MASRPLILFSLCVAAVPCGALDWEIQVVQEDVGKPLLAGNRPLSIALDLATGLPLVAYNDLSTTTTAGLRLARVGSTGWEIETVVHAFADMTEADLELNPVTGHPCIVYRFLHDYLSYAAFDGTSWEISRVGSPLQKDLIQTQTGIVQEGGRLLFDPKSGRLQVIHVHNQNVVLSTYNNTQWTDQTIFPMKGARECRW